MRSWFLLALALAALAPSARAISYRVYSGTELDVDIAMNMIHNFDVNDEISGSIGVEAHLSVSDNCGNSVPVSLGQISISASDAFPGVNLLKCAWHGAELVEDVIKKLPQCLDTEDAVRAFVSDLCAGGCPDCPLQMAHDLQRLRGDISACRSTIIDAADTLIDCSTALGKEAEGGEATFDGRAVSAAAWSQKMNAGEGGVYHNDLSSEGASVHHNRVLAISFGVTAAVCLVAAAALLAHTRKLRAQLGAARDTAAPAGGYVEMD